MSAKCLSAGNLSQNAQQAVIAAYICFLTKFTRLQLLKIEAWAKCIAAHLAAPPHDTQCRHSGIFRAPQAHSAWSSLRGSVQWVPATVSATAGEETASSASQSALLPELLTHWLIGC